jgi:MoaA/NifB/PqqE/SkfB family radical SAM enzyme
VTAEARGAGWQRLKQRALQAEQPLAAYLELTYRCNWRCAFCYNPRHRDKRGLGLVEWTQVLDDLRELGTLSLTLTGGEPLAHTQFPAIARAASERRFALRIFTNGALVSETLADLIADLRPLAVEMSLHGALAETHDLVTGVAGSFVAMLAGLGRLHARGVPLRLKSLLTSVNHREIDAMITLAAELGVPHQLDATVTPRDDGDPAPLQYRAPHESVARMYRLLAERGSLPFAERTAGGVNCGLGRITLAVDPEGEVYPCLQWRHSSLGNVRTTRLVKLWRSSPARAQAAYVSTAVNDAMLERGGAQARFPFCPALAAQHTGDPLLPDDEHAVHGAIVESLRDDAAG